MKVCLDTNIFNGISSENPRILEILSNAHQILIPFVVYAELLYGFKNGARLNKNRIRLDSFILKNGAILLHTTNDTLEIYSDIITDLTKNGRPIPTNDIWIAAQTIESGSQLLTFDKHFKHIPGLRIFDI